MSSEVLLTQSSSPVTWDVTFDGGHPGGHWRPGVSGKALTFRPACGMQSPNVTSRVNPVLPRFHHIFTLTQPLLPSFSWLINTSSYIYTTFSVSINSFYYFFKKIF